MSDRVNYYVNDTFVVEVGMDTVVLDNLNVYFTYGNSIYSIWGDSKGLTSSTD